MTEICIEHLQYGRHISANINSLYRCNEIDRFGNLQVLGFLNAAWVLVFVGWGAEQRRHVWGLTPLPAGGDSLYPFVLFPCVLDAGRCKVAGE